MVKKENKSGKVIKTTRKTYIVDVQGHQYNCTVRGKLVGVPASDIKAIKVGDDVGIKISADGEGVIEAVHPRRTQISRAVEGKLYKEHIIAANVDQMLIIMSSRQPPFKSGLLDRYLVIAEKNSLHASIIINKIDLADANEFSEYREWYQKLGYPLFLTSVETGEGMDKLDSILTGKVSAVVGQSGVGKSSIIQYIEPSLDLKIASTSESTGKGKHTTTHVELYRLGIGGYVIDTPGIRELGLWDIYRSELKHYFTEFRELESNCQFNDCLHLQEPGCSVKEALQNGEIFPGRYENYRNIYESLRSASYELIRPRS